MDRISPNIDEIFFAALELEDRRARSAYLDEICGGDSDLRHRVERLLAMDPLVGDFLESPAVAPPAPRPEPPITAIGPYRLREPIGEGGMGVVYMAEQAVPVRRRVALKLIKPGMDSRQVIARFEAERQALALMDHPHIARVFDGGTTEQGRPYFVMELVLGVPITEYCDRERLAIPERLELFVQVCRAVQHAHQKGIIHRDLKPSNILVTVIDGDAVPKVIDFGVAKATGAALSDRTLYTGFHQFIGTPLYMSPEQADLSGIDVDTRSDVYSLGVLLYELLTGTTPFERETLRETPFDELRRRIREDDPPRPSARLGGLGGRLATVSADRRADARNLDRSVRGELDWIVMKALEKDRRQRYETVDALATDVLRRLDDQPVEACPPSSWYRIGKALRRHRVTLATAALVVTALTFGLVASTWQAIRATKAEHRMAAALELADRHLYAARLRLARQALGLGQWERAQDILDEVRSAPGGGDPRDFAWHYLRTLARREVVRLENHTSEITGLEVFPDGRRIAYGTATGEIFLYDLDAEHIKVRLAADTMASYTLVPSPDGRFMALGGGLDREEIGVLLLDMKSGQVLARLDSFNPGDLQGVWLSEDGRRLDVFVTSEDPARDGLHVFDLAPDPSRPTLRSRLAADWQVGGDPSTSALHFGDASPGLVTLDLRSGDESWLIQDRVSERTLAYRSPDGRHLIRAAEGRVLVSDADTGAEQDRLTLDRPPPFRMLVSDDAGVVVLLQRPGSALVWDRAAGSTRWIDPEAAGHPNALLLAALSADGTLLALSTGGFTVEQTPIRIHEVATGTILATYPGRLESIGALAFAADGSSLFIRSGHAIRRWKFDRGRGDPPPPRHADEAWAVAFSPDGCVLASGSDDTDEPETIKLWDAATGRLLGGWKGGPAMVSALAFSPDGRTLAAAALSPSDNLRLWDAATGRSFASLVGHTDLVRTVAFSPHGALLASAGSDLSIRLWDPASGIEVGLLLGHADVVRQIAFSPNGRMLASASNDRTVRLWDVATRRPGPILLGPSPFASVAFSPRGDLLAAADQDGLITLLDPATGHERGRIHGEDSELRVCFSPDGRTLAAGGAGRTIRLWDVLTGQELLALDGHAAQVNALGFSPDGRTLASCSHDGTVTLWTSREP